MAHLSRGRFSRAVSSLMLAVFTVSSVFSVFPTSIHADFINEGRRALVEDEYQAGNESGKDSEALYQEAMKALGDSVYATYSDMLKHCESDAVDHAENCYFDLAVDAHGNVVSKNAIATNEIAKNPSKYEGLHLRECGTHPDNPKQKMLCFNFVDIATFFNKKNLDIKDAKKKYSKLFNLYEALVRRYAANIAFRLYSPKETDSQSCFDAYSPLELNRYLDDHAADHFFMLPDGSRPFLGSDGKPIPCKRACRLVPPVLKKHSPNGDKFVCFEPQYEWTQFEMQSIPFVEGCPEWPTNECTANTLYQYQYNKGSKGTYRDKDSSGTWANPDLNYRGTNADGSTVLPNLANVLFSEDFKDLTPLVDSLFSAGFTDQANQYFAELMIEGYLEEASLNALGDKNAAVADAIASLIKKAGTCNDEAKKRLQDTVDHYVPLMPKISKKDVSQKVAKLIEPILSANIAKNLIDDSPDEYLVQMAQGAVCVSGLFRRLQKLDVILGGPRFKTKNYSTGTALLAEPVPESDFADVAFEATAQVATSLAGLGVLGMLGDQGMMGSSQTFPDGETLYDVCSPSSKFWSTYNTGTASITIDGTNYSYFYSKKDTPKRGTYSVGEFCKQIGAEYKAIADEINEIVGSYSVLSTPIGKNRAYFELTQKLVDANLEIPKNIKNFEHGNDWNDPAKWVCGVSFNHPETGEKVSTPVYSRSGDFIYEKSTCAQSVPQDILDEIRALNLPNLKYHALGIDYNSRKYRDNPENKSPSCMTRAKNSFNTKSEQLALAKAASEIVTVNKTKVLSGIEDEILRVACGKEKVVASRNLSGPNDPLRPNEKLVAVDAVTTNTRNYKRNKSYRADLIARTIDDSEKTGIRDEVLLRPELMSAFLNCKRRPFERLYTLSGLDVESAKNLSQKMSCDGRDKYRDYACVLKSNIVDPAIADKDIRKAARAKLLADLGQALSFVEAVTAPVLVPMGLASAGAKGGARLVGKTAAIGMGVGGTLGAGLGKAMSHLTETTPEDAAALEGENRKLRALVSRGLAQESELLSSNVALAEIKNQDPVVNGLITGVIGGLIEADIINNTVVKNLDDIAQDSLKAEARSLEKNARRAAKNLPKARVVKYKTKTATLPQSILGGIGMQYKDLVVVLAQAHGKGRAARNAKKALRALKPLVDEKIATALGVSVRNISTNILSVEERIAMALDPVFDGLTGQQRLRAFTDPTLGNLSLVDRVKKIKGELPNDKTRASSIASIADSQNDSITKEMMYSQIYEDLEESADGKWMGVAALEEKLRSQKTGDSAGRTFIGDSSVKGSHSVEIKSIVTDNGKVTKVLYDADLFSPGSDLVEVDLATLAKRLDVTIDELQSVPVETLYLIQRSLDEKVIDSKRLAEVNKLLKKAHKNGDSSVVTAGKRTVKNTARRADDTSEAVEDAAVGAVDTRRNSPADQPNGSGSANENEVLTQLESERNAHAEAKLTTSAQDFIKNELRFQKERDLNVTYAFTDVSGRVQEIFLRDVSFDSNKGLLIEGSYKASRKKFKFDLNKDVETITKYYGFGNSDDVRNLTIPEILNLNELMTNGKLTATDIGRLKNEPSLASDLLHSRFKSQTISERIKSLDAETQNVDTLITSVDSGNSRHVDYIDEDLNTQTARITKASKSDGTLEVQVRNADGKVVAEKVNLDDLSKQFGVSRKELEALPPGDLVAIHRARKALGDDDMKPLVKKYIKDRAKGKVACPSK